MATEPFTGGHLTNKWGAPTTTTGSNTQPYAQTTNTTNTTAGTFQLGPPPTYLQGGFSQGISVGTYQLAERLQTLEPGWRYVRWQRMPDDTDTDAYATPIMALAIQGAQIGYVLADAAPRIVDSTAHDNRFLGILTPQDPYDAAFWRDKAQRAYYDLHAAEVAARLLRSRAARPATSAP